MKSTSQDPALLVGLDMPDDAAVYRVAPDIAIVQTVDFFTPIVDDPSAWGRIAAANALSDVYAMGGKPVTALNLVGWPRGLDFALLGKVLEGAAAACDEAGVSIVGGHSVDDPEPKYGLAVTGTIHPDRIVRKSGAPPGCELVLTKPLGMGVITTGIKEGKTSESTTRAATAIMETLNRGAAEAMTDVGVAAATDVTGFGLIGHLLQMLDGSVSAELDLEKIPVLPEALELARAGIVPGGTKRNLASLGPRVAREGISDEESTVLFDAQTSGGLLMAIPPGATPELLDALDARDVATRAVIGRLVDGDGTVRVSRGG